MTVLPYPHQLVPNIGTLDRLLSEKTDDQQRMHATIRETEQLPYYLRGASLALMRLEDARNEAVKTLDRYGAGSPDARVVLPPDDLDLLSFALDSYLYYVRRTFDALVSYLNRCPKPLGLPASMNDLVTKLKNGVDYKLDLHLMNSNIGYWNDVGARLKGYRDQSQHKAIILSTCVAFRTPDGPALQMLLPDDYTETKPSAIGYKPGVHVMQFALTSFEKTLRLVNTLVERMIDLMADGDLNVRKTGTIIIGIRGTDGLALGGQITGERVPAPETVADVIARATRQ